ncbi:hypothetical protein BJ912DRAFT_1083164 [Pholiota molesta]|nr:hypothetical protein BJ912DRAFT_1083164 [Pholiota molesta]
MARSDESNCRHLISAFSDAAVEHRDSDGAYRFPSPPSRVARIEPQVERRSQPPEGDGRRMSGWMGCKPLQASLSIIFSAARSAAAPVPTHGPDAYWFLSLARPVGFRECAKLSDAFRNVVGATIELFALIGFVKLPRPRHSPGAFYPHPQNQPGHLPPWHPSGVLPTSHVHHTSARCTLCIFYIEARLRRRTRTGPPTGHGPLATTAIGSAQWLVQLLPTSVAASALPMFTLEHLNESIIFWMDTALRLPLLCGARWWRRIPSQPPRVAEAQRLKRRGRWRWCYYQEGTTAWPGREWVGRLLDHSWAARDFCARAQLMARASGGDGRPGVDPQPAYRSEGLCCLVFSALLEEYIRWPSDKKLIVIRSHLELTLGSKAYFRIPVVSTTYLTPHPPDNEGAISTFAAQDDARAFQLEPRQTPISLKATYLSGGTGSTVGMGWNRFLDGAERGGSMTRLEENEERVRAVPHGLGQLYLWNGVDCKSATVDRGVSAEASNRSLQRGSGEHGSQGHSVVAQDHTGAAVLRVVNMENGALIDENEERVQEVLTSTAGSFCKEEID